MAEKKPWTYNTSNGSLGPFDASDTIPVSNIPANLTVTSLTTEPEVLSNLDVFYLFNEIAGTSIVDYSGNDNHGTASADISGMSPDANWITLGGSNFITSYRCPFTTSTSFSIFCRVYPTSATRGCLFGNYVSSTAINLELYTSGSNLILRAYNQSSSKLKDYRSTTIIPLNTASIVGMRWDASTGTLDLFVNGVKETTVTKTSNETYTAGTSFDSGRNFRIGRDNRATPTQYAGKISATWVFDTAISDETIANLSESLVGSYVDTHRLKLNHSDEPANPTEGKSVIYQNGADLIAKVTSGGVTVTNVLNSDGSETTTSMGALINSATQKVTPADADMVGLMDSEDSNILKKLSWSNIKSKIKTYLDAFFSAIGHTHTIIKDADGDTKVDVEQSADEDKIHITVAGTERTKIDSTNIMLNNNFGIYQRQAPLYLSANMYRDAGGWKSTGLTGGYGTLIAAQTDGNVVFYANQTKDVADGSAVTLTKTCVVPLLGLNGQAIAAGVDVWASAANVMGYYSSSKKNKIKIIPVKDIHGKENYLKKILEAEIVEYEYNPENVLEVIPGKKYYGLIAEDLDELGLKHLVNYNEDGSCKNINYSLITVNLLSIIKEQEKRLNDLEKIVENLAKKLKD